MQEEKLLNESESANFACITVETIRQYQNFGLLKPVIQNDQTHYKESALRAFFLLGEKKESVENKNNQTLSEQITVEVDEDLEIESPQGLSTLVQINKQLQQQIQDIKEEREWLKKRIEVLESRSEREQMLSLSDSETIRRLIAAQQEKKKSLWNLALPWFKSEE